MSRDKMITIDDVSKKANVSKTTVSRYLNGKYEYMSEDTRKKIKEIIDELDYRPNAMARSLRSKKSGLIGVIISDISSNFSSILVKGINDVCKKKGYQVIIASTDNNPRYECEYIMSMLDRQAEGIIINTAGNNDDFLKELSDKGVNMVLADRDVKNKFLDTVTSNFEKTTSDAINTLYSVGFEKVAFFSQAMNNSTRIRKLKTFVKVSKKYIENPEELIYIIDHKLNDKKGEVKLHKNILYNSNYGVYDEAIMNFMNSFPNEKKAVLIVNGVATLAFLNNLKNLNINVPEDIGVCGFDDWGWANLVSGGISVIPQPTYDIGVKTAEILIGRINKSIKNKEPIYLELEGEIVLRESTNLKNNGEC